MHWRSARYKRARGLRSGGCYAPPGHEGTAIAHHACDQRARRQRETGLAYAAEADRSARARQPIDQRRRIDDHGGPMFAPVDRHAPLPGVDRQNEIGALGRIIAQPDDEDGRVRTHPVETVLARPRAEDDIGEFRSRGIMPSRRFPVFRETRRKLVRRPACRERGKYEAGGKASRDRHPRMLPRHRLENNPVAQKARAPSERGTGRWDLAQEGDQRAVADQP